MKEQGSFRLSRLYEFLSLAVEIGMLTFFNVYLAYTRPIWRDEFMTLFISRLSSIGQMLAAAPGDGQPPLQYVITHFTLAITPPELGLRLPELVAFSIAGLLVYKIVRLRGSVPQGLFAIAVVMHSYLSQQAYTARPYGLLLMFTALTFACWQQACSREGRRTPWLCGVAFGTAGAILSHHFGAVHVGLFLVAGEAARISKCRRLDWQMLLSICLGASTLLITLPLAQASQRVLGAAVLHSAGYPYKPDLASLILYFQVVPVFLLLLVVISTLLLYLGNRWLPYVHMGPQEPRHEWIAALALSSLLPVVLIISSLNTGQFAARYSIGTMLGLAIVLAWSLPKIRAIAKAAHLGLLLGTFIFVAIVAKNITQAQLRDPIAKADPAATGFSPLLLRASGDLPIVVENAYDYPQQWWYAPSDIRRRLFYLADPPYAVTQQDFLPELSSYVDRKYAPLPLPLYSEFLREHTHFWLLSSGSPTFLWTAKRLANSGWHLKETARNGGDALFDVSE